jgi:predicted RNA-binding protein with RPS1 domain
VLTGKVVRVERFGAFVDVGAERPGMVHVSEMATGYVNSPQEVVKIGDDVQVKVIKVNRKKKQIDLSMKALEEPVAPPAASPEEDDGDPPTAMELALRRAMQGTEMAAELAEVRKASKQPKREREKRSTGKHREQQEEILARTLRNRVK